MSNGIRVRRRQTQGGAGCGPPDTFHQNKARMVRHKPSRSVDDDDDMVLPVSHSDLKLPSRPYFTKRSARVLLILVLASCALVSSIQHAATHLSTCTGGQQKSIARKNRLPPLYESYHDYERHLPQHNLSLPQPRGRDAKFFWAANHVHSSGWGNSMQELLVNALLSHTVNRAYVYPINLLAIRPLISSQFCFDNYTWDPDGPDYSLYNGKLIPSRIPHSAIISGPIIGSSWPPGDPTPRSVSREYFRRVCPQPLVIDSNEINEKLRLDTTVPASVIFDKWVDKLNSIRDPCVEIKRSSFQIFEICFLPSYLRPSTATPISPAELHNVEPLLTPDKTNPGRLRQPLCPSANWAADWNGFNKFTALPDKFRPPPDGGKDRRQTRIYNCI
ncbi:hypothetical protein EDC04DRAFT_2952265 [Pisolithus marmoratus]|nr:hypothetical protein EDC04DRAFT_2952265 [Pisolithus marmoratus]